MQIEKQLLANQTTILHKIGEMQGDIGALKATIGDGGGLLAEARKTDKRLMHIEKAIPDLVQKEDCEIVQNHYKNIVEDIKKAEDERERRQKAEHKNLEKSRKEEKKLGWDKMKSFVGWILGLFAMSATWLMVGHALGWW